MTDVLEEFYAHGDEYDEARHEIVSAAMQIDYEKDTVSFLARQRVSVGVFPHVPSYLVDVIDIDVPGEGDRGSDFVRTRATSEALSFYHDDYIPALDEVDITQLSSTQLMQFLQYVRAYQTYINEMAARVDAQIKTLERRIEFAQKSMILMYQGEKRDIRNARIATEPYIVHLTEAMNTKIVMKNNLTVLAKSLENKAEFSSRDLTRRGQEIASGMDSVSERSARMPRVQLPNRRKR